MRWFIGNIWWLANLFELNLVLDEKSFCILENELHVFDFSNVIWKLVHMTFGSWVYSLFHYSEFLRYLWGIYEFSWFYSIYFWILVETCSYKLFEGFHARFEIFRFLFEQWSQIGVGIEKIGRIQTCQIFGSADGPRVRGGQSAVNWTCSPEALQRSCQPQKFIADSPPKDRGRSAHVWAEAVSVSCSVKNFKGGRSAKGPRTVRDWTESWGRPDLTYIGCPLHLPTKPNTYSKSVSLFLSQARGEDDKVKPFWSGSRTVRAHPRTLLKIVHHVFSVFQWIPNSCSWISLLERVRVRCSDLFFDHGFVQILGGSYS